MWNRQTVVGTHFKNLTRQQFYEILLKLPKLLNSVSSSENDETKMEEGLSDESLTWIMKIIETWKCSFPNNPNYW